LRQTLQDQKRECNAGIWQIRRAELSSWIDEANRRIMLSPDVVERCVIPELNEKCSVFFFVIDCLRLDQWLINEELLSEYFTFRKQYYFSMFYQLQSYARNAIFSDISQPKLKNAFPRFGHLKMMTMKTAGIDMNTNCWTSSWSVNISI